MDPPYNSARSRTMARPSPEPGTASSARTPRCSTDVRLDGSSPGPSSSTVVFSRSPFSDDAIEIHDVAHLQAFSMMLPRGPPVVLETHDPDRYWLRSADPAARTDEAARGAARRPRSRARTACREAFRTPRRGHAPCGNRHAAASTRPHRGDATYGNFRRFETETRIKGGKQLPAPSLQLSRGALRDDGK